MALALAAYPQIWWRLALGFPVFIGFPFLFGPPAYVSGQCMAALNNLRQCSYVSDHRFADLNGLLRTFGIPLAGKASLAVRALSGGILMCVCWLASRRESEPRRSLLWLSAATGFLMLFNPMTEANSYVILAPVLALMAWWQFNSGAKRTGWLFTGMALSMGFLPNLLHGLFGNYFALAWYPAMTIGFLLIITRQIFSAINSETTPVEASTVSG